MRSSRDRLEKGEQEKQLRVNLSQQPTWEALEKSMRRERGPDWYLTQKLGNRVYDRRDMAHGRCCTSLQGVKQTKKLPLETL